MRSKHNRMNVEHIPINPDSHIAPVPGFPKGIQGDPTLAPPLHRKIWKTLDENDDVASKYSQFKNYLPNMEVTDLKMRYWRFFS